jgi:hypothetical protein
VSHAWEIVAHAVATNQLGLGAKVSPKREDPETGNRLICIYTDDFSDKEDVIRVLRKIKELGLLPHGRPIYYKCGKPIVLLGSYGHNRLIWNRCIHTVKYFLWQQIGHPTIAI